MDFDAAKAVAAEKNLPILMDFSGSDWCGWCQIMEFRVFNHAEWTAYATNNIMMVLIDFPRDKSLVPEKYIARNNMLKALYTIRGFPTFVVLDSDGRTVMGRLGAGDEKTPESFIDELHKLFIYRDNEVEEYTKTLSKADAKRYKQIIKKINKTKSEISENKKRIIDISGTIDVLEKNVEEQESAAAEFRASRLGEEQFKKYKELQSKLDDTKQKMDTWLRSNPEQSEETRKTLMGFTATISEIEAELNKF
jgi:thioredoxin-related protein